MRAHPGWPIPLLAVLMLASLGADRVPSRDCTIVGQAVAVPNPDDPSLGAWKYCVTLSWDAASHHALSHLDWILPLEDCPIACADFPYAASDPAGTSDGTTASGAPCVVPYRAELACHGDPSIDDPSPLIKYTPHDDAGCSPGAIGTGRFCFYSDWLPVAAPTPNQWLVFKAGLQVCYGMLTGVVPGCGLDSHVCCLGETCLLLSENECAEIGGVAHPEWDSCGPPNPCDVVPAAPDTWGGMKNLYR